VINIINLFKRKNGNSPRTEQDKKAKGEVEIMFYPEPRICLFDLEENYLVTKGYNCYAGSLGVQLEIPNTTRRNETLCGLNHDFPPNLHEYQILIINLQNDKKDIYSDNMFNFEKNAHKKTYSFLTEYPESIFDPRGYTAEILSDIIKELTEKEFILIVFSDSEKITQYDLLEIDSDGSKVVSRDKYSNYSFKEMPIKSNKYGKIINIIQGIKIISNFLNKFKDEFSYSVVFEHPTHYEGGKYIKNENFIPLMTNGDAEIISYLEFQKESVIFVFPQISDKNKFLEILLSSVLPELFPSIFPHNSKFAWVDNSDYVLPNQLQLLSQKEELQEDYNRKLLAIEKAIEENYKQYSFLHDLITQTDSKLVKAVEVFFKWLGFENIINVDETDPKLKEEDLRIELDDGLLVIEVKGIGGTSTDSECSQISKIRYRRAEERGKFDVFGLYIVNHQRYIPPKERTNPPFNDTQIKDAVSDKRGLLTTNDLYKLYGLIEEGIITKENAQKCLLNYGLVQFKPENIFSLGMPTEYLKECKVVILNLNGTIVKKGDEILAYKKDSYLKCQIISIQKGDIEVEETDIGEIGLLLSKSIPRNSELFLLNRTM